MSKCEQNGHEGKQTLQLMKRILIHLRGDMDELLRPLGVTTAQLQMLRAIHNAPGSSGAQLARECYVTPQTAQGLIRHLESGGFIVRGKDRVNDRIVTASVTPAGNRLLEKAEKTSLELQAQLWVGISASEAQKLNDLLSKCLRNLGEEPSNGH
jgi:DNA-binding MarR family transcriptional regulator